MYDNRVDDISGKKFGKLEVIKRTEKRSGKNNQYYLWECKCECGNTTYTEAYKLKRGRKKSCGCLEGAGRPYNFKDDRKVVLWQRLYSNTIQKRSKKNGYKTDIKLEKFIEISKQNCFYCGDKEVQEAKDNANGKTITDTVIRFNGIDRIDSSKGYMLDNVVSCCKHCNTAKNTMSQESFKNHIRKIYENFAK